MWGYAHKMVSVFVVDATFVTDPAKFISGSLLALSAMVSMQLPHVNVLSKCDLVEEASMERVLEMESALQLWDVLGGGDRAYPGGGGGGPIPSPPSPFRNHMQPPVPSDGADAPSPSPSPTVGKTTRQNSVTSRRDIRERRWNRLTEAICSLLDDYSMVGFIPLNINEEDSISHVLAAVDHAIQYGEDLEVRGADYDDEDVVGDGAE
jgi:hypothetical protein